MLTKLWLSITLFLTSVQSFAHDGSLAHSHLWESLIVLMALIVAAPWLFRTIKKQLATRFNKKL